MNYNIKINEFEGPLDLLLHLIKQSNINIQDIDISQITTQYLKYLNNMQELNINIASSYIVMAAELMEIKSKSLLPQTQDESSEEEETISKENLINKLIEYQKYKEMTSVFKDMETSRQEIYIKSPEKISNYIENKIQNTGDTTIDDLVKAFTDFLDRKDKEKPLETKITEKEYSIKKRKQQIKELLKSKEQLSFTDLFEEKKLSFIIVTFLSILEMTKEQTILVDQSTNFNDITIKLKVI